MGSQRLRYLLAFAAIAGVGCVHQAYLTLVHPGVPYMDSLRLLTQQDAWLGGRLSIREIWAGTAHHGLIFQALLYLNTTLFKLDAMLANRATGVVIAVLSALLAIAFLRDRAGDSRPAPTVAVIATVALFAVLLSSWAGFETLLLDLGLGLWLKNLAFVAYFLAFDRFLREDTPSLVGACGLALAGVVLVLFVAMGWSYAFVGAAWAMQALAGWTPGRSRRIQARLLLPPLALLVAIIAYTFAGAGISGGVMQSHAVGGAVRLLQPFYALGTTWVGSEAFGHHYDIIWLLPAGIATCITAAVGLIARWRRGMRSGSLLPIALLGYGALTALSVSVARGGLGTPAVMASRYYMDLVLFLIGAIWLAFEALARRDRRPGNTVLFAGALLVALLLAGQYWTAVIEWRVAPFRAHAYQAMAEAFLEGAGTEEDARLLQSPQPYPSASAAIMRAQRLSVFANAPAHCAPEDVRWGSGWHAPERAGHWMADEGTILLPPCRCPAVLDLFLPATFTARTIDVVPSRTATPAQHVALAPGSWASARLEGGAAFRLHASQATVPSRDIPGNGDRRTLGVLATRVRFDCAVPQSR